MSKKQSNSNAPIDKDGNSVKPLPPPPPTPPLNRMLLSQGNWFGICNKCDSSIKFRLFFWKKSLGCIHPECSNYWKLKV